MEFTNEIFFNKNLIEDETVILTYSGKLYREHSGEISIVYGFGDNWEHTTETPMKEIENGFEVTIEMKKYNTFNFCFKNNYNIWDNNFGFNYIAPISQKQEAPTLNQNIENNSETSNTSTTIENTTDTAPDTNEAENSNEIADESSKENTSKVSILDNNEIENVFASLLDSILDVKPFENTNFKKDFGFDLDNTVKKDEFIDCDKIFKEYYDEISSSKDFDEAKLNNISNVELDKLFNEIFQDTPIDEDKDIEITPDTDISDLKSNNLAKNEELDELMDDILNSIKNPSKYDVELITPIQSSSTAEDTTNKAIDATEDTTTVEFPTDNNSKTDETESTNSSAQIVFEEIKENDVVENCDLPAIREEEDLFDKFIDASYNLIVKIGCSCKKLAKLIKIKAQEYGIIKK